MPTRDAAVDVITNSVIFVRVTGTPAFRAAPASPPDAKIQLPKAVRVSRIVATAVRAIHHTSEIWKDAPPIGIVVAKSGRADSKPAACSIPDTRTVPVMPLVMARFAPFSTKNVPSVTTNDGRAVRTTSTPLMKPITAPSRRVAMMAGHRGQPRCVTSSPAKRPDVPTMTPDDRSNSPEIISSATKIATMPTGAAKSVQPAAPCSEAN